jgi:hypothetical protein
MQDSRRRNSGRGIGFGKPDTDPKHKHARRRIGFLGLGGKTAAQKSRDEAAKMTPEERAERRAKNEKEAEYKRLARKAAYELGRGNYQVGYGALNDLKAMQASDWDYVPPVEKAQERYDAYHSEMEKNSNLYQSEMEKAIAAGDTDAAMQWAHKMAVGQYNYETEKIYKDRFGNWSWDDNEMIQEGRGLWNIAFPQEEFDWQGAVEDRYYWTYDGNPADYREGEDSTLKSGLNRRLNDERLKLGDAGQMVRRNTDRERKQNKINELAQANYDAVMARANRQ